MVPAGHGIHRSYLNGKADCAVLPRSRFGIGGVALAACTSGKVSFFPARLSDLNFVLLSIYVGVLVVFVLINNGEYFL